MSGREVGGVSVCWPRNIIHARWVTTSVKCGDKAQMRAETVNIPGDTAATFAVKKKIDNGMITTVNTKAKTGSVEGEWISQKPSADWNGEEVKFNVTSGGEAADSNGNQLSFHRYPDIARASLSEIISSPPGALSPRFGWDKKVFIEFTGRSLILTVKVHLVNRIQVRPTRGEKESYEDFVTRCNATPVGDPVPAPSKRAIQAAVEAIYRNKLDLHRQLCLREDSCNCPPSHFCCKFETQVRLEFVETSGAMIHEVNLWPQSARGDASNWYRIESRPGKTWAHEVGHLMGFYDEYIEGATGNSPWAPSSSANIMGSGTGVPDYYFEEFRSWYSSQAGEVFNLIAHT